MNNLTDRSFWLQYWEKKKNLVFKIPDHYLFLKELETITQQHSIQNFLEIGGFPGYYSVWLRKKAHITTTLLDFVVHDGILKQLETANGLEKGSVQVLETDLFHYQPIPAYDLVASNGLIEHFQDTKSILERHVSFLKKEGVLFVTLPNFRGINGWFQRHFDQENYAKHNIDSMDIERLTSICRELELKNISIQYNGEFMLWLENSAIQPIWVNALLKATWLPLKIFSKIFQLKNRLLSPYIVITAIKK